MADYFMQHMPSRQELEDLLIADLALTLGFTLTMFGGLAGAQYNFRAFLAILPISFMAVTLSFALHEYMHKIVAQKFGAIAGFKKSDQGIMFTVLTAMFGFLIGLPGATIIYSNRFTRREEGYVSLAGPLTNFVIFLVFFGIAIVFRINAVYPPDLNSYSYIDNAVGTTLFISVLLAFFNMLPIYPLDGSKVFRWNKLVFAAMILITFSFLSLIIPLSALLFGLVFMLILALFLSFFFGNFRI